jgi:hypothetical protein
MNRLNVRLACSIAIALVLAGCSSAPLPGRSAGPCYWKNGVRYDLPIEAAVPRAREMPAALNDFAGDIHIVGNHNWNPPAFHWTNGALTILDGVNATDVFVEGGHTYISGSSSTGYACYWIDNIRHDLPFDYYNQYVQAIAVKDSVIYLAGTCDNPNVSVAANGACYWTVDETGTTLHRLSSPVTGTNDYATATGIYLDGTDLYISGYYEGKLPRTSVLLEEWRTDRPRWPFCVTYRRLGWERLCVRNKFWHRAGRGEHCSLHLCRWKRHLCLRQFHPMDLRKRRVLLSLLLEKWRADDDNLR